ncbi:MAG: efflux RND transporter periplasmic adaptor subunit [Crocinitomicaceae bacterium]
MKSKVILTVLGLVWMLFSCGSDNKEIKSAPNAGMKSTVEVVEIEPGDVARVISIPGTILPNEEVQLFSEVSGRIQSINFQEGQTINKGAVLLVVDTDILKAQRASLHVEADLARKDEARKKVLLDAKGISLEEYEKSASQLANIQSQIDLVNVQISKATLRAPFSGRIGLRRVSEGAFISPSTAITTIIQENPIKIEFAISESYASIVKIGQTITFKTDHSQDDFSAAVYAYEPLIDAETRMLTLRAKAQNHGKLMVGTFVSVDYDLGKEQNAFMVPSESIIPVLKGQKIFVVRNGEVVEVPVEIGIRTAEKVQIIGDVKASEKVLITGLLAVRAGTPVNVKIVKK